MHDKNGLNDIILNKSAKSNSTKKILLTIATFAITLIVVVIIMNQISGKKKSALPHAPQMIEAVVEEAAVKDVTAEAVVQEAETEIQKESIPVIENAIEHTSELTEDALVEEEVPQRSTAQIPDGKDETERIFDAVFEEPVIIEEPDYTTTAKQKTATKPTAAKAEKKQVLKPKPIRPSGKYDAKSKSVVKADKPSAVVSGKYYIQVGSFAKYAPSKAFLDKITKRGYTYTYHKVTRSGKTLNKVLVGPFKTQAAAREALPVIKRSVEPGAFLIKI